MFIVIGVSFIFLAAVMYLKKPVAELSATKSYQHNAEPVIQQTTKVVSINKEAAVAEQ
jgi:hypothetical protein